MSPPESDHDAPPAPPPDAVATCLERTRSAVLNVLMAAAAGIAASGVLLRWRDGWAVAVAPGPQRRGLMGGLFLVTVVSYGMRRVLTRRVALAEPSRRPAEFFRAHVLAASVAALAVPLGLAYGWLVRPRLDAVAPFWVVALALGFLAFPRSSDLDVFEDHEREPGPVPLPNGPTS